MSLAEQLAEITDDAKNTYMLRSLPDKMMYESILDRVRGAVTEGKYSVKVDCMFRYFPKVLDCLICDGFKVSNKKDLFGTQHKISWKHHKGYKADKPGIHYEGY